MCPGWRCVGWRGGGDRANGREHGDESWLSRQPISNQRVLSAAFRLESGVPRDRLALVWQSLSRGGAPARHTDSGSKCSQCATAEARTRSLSLSLFCSRPLRQRLCQMLLIARCPAHKHAARGRKRRAGSMSRSLARSLAFLQRLGLRCSPNADCPVCGFVRVSCSYLFLARSLVTSFRTAALFVINALLSPQNVCRRR